MADNITVSIKVRPLIKRERDNRLIPQWRVRDNTIVHIDGNGDPFVFDHIFDETVSTRDLFERVCRPIVVSTLNGINGTIFAYGQTSSGKTYTMMGDEQELGVVALTAQEIFKEIENNKDRQFLIRVGYIEIYNEKIFDLLDKSNTNLKIFENLYGDVTLNYREAITNCPEQIVQYLEEGNKLKRIGDTNMNERSSRSHTIFRITIESSDADRKPGDENDAVQISNLNLVDLAGSERADQTGATGSRLKEGAHINKSLLSLSCVIQKLSENADNLKYINYRDSKLTRILQASLGGNAVTSMICNITPAAFEESYSTLCFANRAKTIKNKPKVNEVVSEAAMMKRLEQEIKRLQEQLKSEQSKNSQIKTSELQHAITMRANQIINSQAHINFEKSRRRTWCPSSSGIVKPVIVIEQDARLMPPPPPFLKQTRNSAVDIMSGSSSLEKSPTIRAELTNHPNADLLLARKIRSTTPSRGDDFNLSDEFIPGELAEFNDQSPQSIGRQIHTPCALKNKRRSRRSSTGDSPANFIDYEKRCRELEQELLELQEFTNLEKNLDMADIKNQLHTREEMQASLQFKEQRLDSLEERCKDLETELRQKREQIFDIEKELIVARKERESAVKEAEQCRNLQNSIQVEYEIYQQRAKTREKELVESLQESRMGTVVKDDGQKRLDAVRKELGQLEVHNYELQVQLEKCNTELQQLRTAGHEHSEKLEKIKTVLAKDIPRADAKKLFRALTNLRAISSDEDLLMNTSIDTDDLVESMDDSSGSTSRQSPAKVIVDEGLKIESDELKQQVLSLEEQLRTLQAQLKQQETDNTHIRRKEQQVQNELKKMTAEYEELSTQVLDNIQDMEKCKSENDQLENKLRESQSSMQRLIDDMELLRTSSAAEIQKLLDNNKLVEEQLEKERTLIRSLEQQIMEGEQKYSHLQTLLDEQCHTIKQLQDENSDLTVAVQSLSKKLESLDEQLTNGHDSADNSIKETSFVEQVELISEVLPELEQIEIKVRDLEQENCDLSQQIDSLSKTAPSEEKVTEQQIEIQELTTKIGELTDCNCRLQSLKEQLENDVRSLEHKLNVESENTARLQREQNDFLKDISEKNVVIDSNSKELDELRNAITQLQDKLKTLQQHLETSKMEQKVAVDAIETEKQDLVARLEEKSVEMSRLKEQWAEKDKLYQERTMEQRVADDAIKTEKQDLIVRLEENAKEICSLKEQWAEKDKQSQEHEANLKIEKEHSNELQVEINNLERIKLGLEEELKSLHNTHELKQSEWEKIADELKQEAIALQQTLEQKNSDLLERTVEFDNLQQVVDELEIKLKFVQNQLTDSENKRQAEFNKSNELQEQISKLKAEVATLQQNNEQYLSEISALKQYQESILDVNENTKNANELLSKDLEDEISKLQQMKTALEQNVDELKEKINELQTTLSDVIQQKNKAISKVLSMEVEMEESSAIREQLEQDVRTLREDLGNLKQQLNEQMEKLEHFQKQREDHENELKERDTVIESKSTEHTDLKNVISQLENKLAKLEEQKEEEMHSWNAMHNNMLDEFRKEKDILNEKLQNASVETVSLKELLSEKEKHLQQDEMVLKSEKDRSNELQQKISTLEEEKLTLETSLEKLQQEYNIITDNHAQLSGKAKYLEQKNTELEAELANLKAELAIGEAKLVDVKQKLSGKITELNELADANDRNTSNLKDTLTEREHVISELAQQVKDLEGGKCQLEGQLNEERDKLQHLTENQVPSMKALIEQLTEQHGSIKFQLVTRDEQLAQKSQQIEHLTELNQREKEHNEQLTQQLEAARLQPALLPDGRPSLGDGKVAQALRKENEDLLKQLNELQKVHVFKTKQLQDKIDDLKQLEVECVKLREEISTMRHESSFQEKEEEIVLLTKKVTQYESVSEETNNKHRSLQRQNDELRVRHQNLVMEMDDLRRIADKERKSRRQSTHDDRRGVSFNTRDIGVLTDPSSTDCSCLDMDNQIKNLKKQLTIKECQLNTQKMLSAANPLKNDVVELRNLLKDRDSDIMKLHNEIQSLSTTLLQERSQTEKPCNACVRLQRLRTLRKDKSVGTDRDDSEIPSSTTPTVNGKLEETQEELQKLQEKYQQIKRLCRIRNEKIVSLSQDIMEKENESTNVNKSVQREVSQLKRQLQESEDKCVRMQKLLQNKSKAEKMIQTDPPSNEELEMLRSKYEKYKNMASSLVKQLEQLKGK